MGNPGQTNYSASKGGLNAIKSLAKRSSFKRNQIQCSNSGFIQTDMTHELKEEVKAEYEKYSTFKIWSTI